MNAVPEFKKVPTYVFIYLPTSDLYLIEDYPDGIHFYIPESLQSEFLYNNVNKFFLNLSECLGEL